ncbi:MerR family transcriptional regulator [Fodinicola acaciae]|uniref:helix-turn-helix domain-containing protein n=1 Tax=Fodinicola acaciae TaxID=2681555 RepID=UPI001C9E73BF|nr:MerR family transcriptional regulator [Fodinicola acaciae]
MTPIREVADHFGLPLSTLHYWERRGLVVPARRGARRVYDTDQVYRIALIVRWRRQGRMSIDEIARLLRPNVRWQEAVEGQLDGLQREIGRLTEACDYLRYLLTCRQGEDLERCPAFRAEVSVPPSAS